MVQNSKLGSYYAQPAQQALCKVRTEVVEVTRAMLDRSNANFLLWPPCVEVQRCSGCCNTKSLQCVPVVTHTRYLQVMKIEYINKRPTYAKAVVSVVDHVECRCQPAPRLPVSTSGMTPEGTLSLPLEKGTVWLGRTHLGLEKLFSLLHTGHITPAGSMGLNPILRIQKMLVTQVATRLFPQWIILVLK
uniref:Platelet-derived growth factor subunit B n=1 Tax=Lates calcarifer TaxID=8187 RepID=A0A4W6D2Y9_LATCA